MATATKWCFIPARQTTGGRSITMAALRKADVIVTADATPTSNGIALATFSPVSHAMLYDGAGNVIEAVSSGVHVAAASAAWRGSRVAVALRRKGLTDKAADDAVAFAKSAAANDASYDYVGAASLAVLVLLREAGIHPNGGPQFYCSELILRAFKTAGFPIAGNATMGAPGYLLEAKETLSYVGHLMGTRCETFLMVQPIEPGEWRE